MIAVFGPILNSWSKQSIDLFQLIRSKSMKDPLSLSYSASVITLQEYMYCATERGPDMDYESKLVEIPTTKVCTI